MKWSDASWRFSTRKDLNSTSTSSRATLAKLEPDVKQPSEETKIKSQTKWSFLFFSKFKRQIRNTTMQTSYYFHDVKMETSTYASTRNSFNLSCSKSTKRQKIEDLRHHLNPTWLRTKITTTNSVNNHGGSLTISKIPNCYTRLKKADGVRGLNRREWAIR